MAMDEWPGSQLSLCYMWAVVLQTVLQIFTMPGERTRLSSILSGQMRATISTTFLSTN